ncbi:MAG: hypothetical protein IKP86_11085 [Anaerolineaceae bacterium]|nr:hypothetical protein [Anaerolineaceae bacterium]
MAEVTEDGGSSYVGNTSVTLKENGTVYYEVFGGGHAYGAGSISKTGSTQVLIEGTTDYVLGGGFAEDGGSAGCEQTHVTVSENAEIPVALFSGGSAAGKGSLSTVENAAALLNGRANWVFSGDFAFSEGETRLIRASLLQIGPSGAAEIAYLGSFSSDDGSYAFVNTAELQNCGAVEQIVQNSQATDGGKAETLIRSLLTCSEPQQLID